MLGEEGILLDVSRGCGSLLPSLDIVAFAVFIVVRISSVAAVIAVSKLTTRLLIFSAQFSVSARRTSNSTSEP